VLPVPSIYGAADPRPASTPGSYDLARLEERARWYAETGRVEAAPGVQQLLAGGRSGS
jgi:hypothetical protein